MRTIKVASRGVEECMIECCVYTGSQLGSSMQRSTKVFSFIVISLFFHSEAIRVVYSEFVEKLLDPFSILTSIFGVYVIKTCGSR